MYMYSAAEARPPGDPNKKGAKYETKFDEVVKALQFQSKKTTSGRRMSKG
jgi:hypothetical protein